jgi:type IV pilus assembly protein PilN
VIRINLLPVREVALEAGRRQETRLMALGAVLVVALLLAAETTSRLRLTPVRAEHDALVAELKSLDAKASELGELEQKRAELDERLKTIELLEQKKSGPVHVLADLSDAAPNQVWLVEFTENRGAATITGMALDNQTIAAFMRKLAASPYFTSVDLVETTQAVEDGLPLKRFVVQTRLAYQGGGADLKDADDQPLDFPKPPKPVIQKREPRKGGRV